MTASQGSRVAAFASTGLPTKSVVHQQVTYITDMLLYMHYSC